MPRFAMSLAPTFALCPSSASASAHIVSCATQICTSRLLGADEGKEIGVYLFTLSSTHPVWEAPVGLQRPVLHELGAQWTGIRIGNNLIIVPVHDQSRHA